MLHSWRSSFTFQSYSFSSSNFWILPAHRFPAICAASTNKDSAGCRKVKINVELCNDLHDFVSALDFSQGHVSTSKELTHHRRNDYISTKGPPSANNNKDLDSKESEVEVNRLKLLLVKMQRCPVLMMVFLNWLRLRLNTAGDGKKVELTGSFNGWQNWIEMELQPSTIQLVTKYGDESFPRNSQLWRSVLWLYPGTYEIKIIVDGHGIIDQQRESVTKGTIHNNILQSS